MPTALRRYRLRAGQTPTDFVRQPRNLEPRTAANEVVRRSPTTVPAAPGSACAPGRRCRTGTRPNRASGTRSCRRARPRRARGRTCATSTRNRPWNAMSSWAYSLMYQRSTASRYPCREGGDSGPTNRRMSTTTSGPFTPVVRRMMPSGSVNCGVPGVGRGPPIHARPRRRPAGRRRGRGDRGRGGRARRETRPGRARWEPRADDVGAASGAGAFPSHGDERQRPTTHASIGMTEPAQTKHSRAIGNDTRIPIARFLGRTGGHARQSPPQRRGARRCPSAPRQPPPVPPALRHGRGRRGAVLLHRRAGDPLASRPARPRRSIPVGRSNRSST